MRIDDASEDSATTLPPGRLSEQIVILLEENATKGCRAIEEIGVRDLVGLVFVRRDDIHLAQSQAEHNCTRHVVIHVQLERHAP